MYVWTDFLAGSASHSDEADTERARAFVNSRNDNMSPEAKSVVRAVSLCRAKRSGVGLKQSNRPRRKQNSMASRKVGTALTAHAKGGAEK
eukprot:g11280.t1